jgi:uncharacterized UPF0160 family protein
MKTPTVMITHNGVAHADDVMAGAIIKATFPIQHTFRTRDETLMSSLRDRAIIFDVGGKYDGVQYFDHHQNDKEMRDANTPYSACGLIWKHFGKQYLESISIDEANIDEVWRLVDVNVIRLIDVGDNGVQNGDTKYINHPFALNSLITRCTRDGSWQDMRYEMAVEFVGEYLRQTCYEHQERIECRKIIDLALERYPEDKEIAVFNFFVADREYLSKQRANLKFIINPSEDGSQWNLSTVRDDPSAFVNRKNLISQAGGLKDQALSDAVGIPDLMFCHSGLFFACGKTMESVLALAELSLKGIK